MTLARAGAIESDTERATTGHQARAIDAARRLLQEYSRAHGHLRSPVPVFSIARWMGYQVILLSSVGEEFSGLVSTRQKLIGINAHHHRHRQRFSVAHEIAHILLRHPAESHCSIREIARYNAEADSCAGEILIPGELLVPLLKKGWSVDLLADRFDVSREALRMSMSGKR